jgi:hypothetical protein
VDALETAPKVDASWDGVSVSNWMSLNQAVNVAHPPEK